MAARIPTKWNVDKLIINGKLYAQPNDHDTFVHSRPSIKTREIHHTSIHQEKGSSFQGQVVKVEDKDQVILFLHKLFTNHNVAKRHTTSMHTGLELEQLSSKTAVMMENLEQALSC